jgi:putative ABC transport system substrate-binding protein
MLANPLSCYPGQGHWMQFDPLRRRQFMTLLGSAAAAWPLAARGQFPDGARHIGVLMGLAEDDPDTKARLIALRQGLEKLGWVEGRNLRIDYRFAPAGAGVKVFAKELVELRPDMILSNASPATAALQRETSVIPIVSTGVADPIGSGFVAGLARPGGNITGFLLFESSITGKWLAMLKDVAPDLARAALVINPKSAPYYEFYLHAAQEAASSLGIELVLAGINNAPTEIEQTIARFARLANSGLVLAPDTNTNLHRDLIISLAARHRLAAVYSDRLFVTAGGLMCYSTDRADQFRTAASYVDRILRGAKPADLPVQAPTKYQTVVNLKTARALGLTVPPALLVAADEVIE